MAAGKPLIHRGKTLGAVYESVSAQEIVDLLERFVYTFHNPDPHKGVGWNLRESYRRPVSQFATTDYGFAPSSDPYLIAAFLRFWAHAHSVRQATPGASGFRASDGVYASPRSCRPRACLPIT